MFRMLRSARYTRSVLFLGICMLTLTAVLLQPAQAAFVSQTIDNKLDEFARGQFQRAALSSLRDQALSPKDEVGAVQLAPIGLLTKWFESPFLLPERIVSMGATAIGNRIYVIGGEIPAGNQTQTSAKVWSAAIDTETGAPIDPGWEAEPALPGVQHSIQPAFVDPVTTKIAEISRPAVTSVTNADGSGYIYVIGGNVSRGGNSVSSFAVRIGVVGTDGRIKNWLDSDTNTGIRIPSPDSSNPFEQRGLQFTSAVSFTTDGKTYIYLIGGLRRYLEGTGGGGANVKEEGSKKVFYAQVGANGLLVKPSNPSQPGWDVTAADIPIPVGQGEGLWKAVATVGSFVGSGANALYLIGGQKTVDPAQYSQAIYRAQIGGDGKLTWDTWQGTLPAARSNHAGVEFRGSFYLTGGQPGTDNEPDRGVLTSYVKDDLTLPTFGSPGSNFLASNALPKPRTLHGSVVVATSAGTAFVYVLGGRGDTTDAETSDDQGTNSVIYGKIGESEVENRAYAPDGWYYSQPYRITFDRAKVQEISWTALVTRTASPAMDIALDYRTSNANDCNRPGWTDVDWKPIDGSSDTFRSQRGENSVAVGTPETRCFQYRAKLTTDDIKATPSLLNVSIKIFIPGAPDLKPVDLKERRGGEDKKKLTGLDISVLNQNDVEPTFAADIDGGGSFYVDLCVFGPGETVVEPELPVSESNPQCAKAYASINKSQLPAGAKYRVRQWFNITNDQPMTSQAMAALFPAVGTYTIIVAVDSTDYVDESTPGGEDNNIGQLSVEVFADPQDPTKPDVDFEDNTGIFLPIIGR